ncbi:MAG: sulfurtransferase-like selenium metabolism protein YedF [Clostridiales bacterium]|nr:sulfurtransferase-like selenium metabolism protein YedF [Clostridiales bacterium]
MSANEKTIDARGIACPQPVIMARQAMDQGVETIIITVDNMAAVENLKRLSDSRGYVAAISGMEGNYTLILDGEGVPKPEKSAEKEKAAEKPETAVPAPSAAWGVFVGKDTIGIGDEELGKNLMRMYFYTLTQEEKAPDVVIFMNGGVKVPTGDEQVAEHLKTLEEKGTRVLVCGTCLNFYGLMDQLKAGTVSNMAEIVEAMGGCGKVITL